MEEKGENKKKRTEREARRFNWLTPIAHVVNKLAAPNFAASEETDPPGVSAQPSSQGRGAQSSCKGLGKSRALRNGWGIGSPASRHNYSRPTETAADHSHPLRAHTLFIEGLGLAGGNTEPLGAELRPQCLLFRLLCKRDFNGFPCVLAEEHGGLI